jgi:DNA transposition AAA+ family ATPase
MALQAEFRKKLLAANLPESKTVREELLDYLARTGLERNDFARRINYSSITLRYFVSGNYHTISGDDSAVRFAIREFIRAHPIATDEIESGQLYSTENFRLLRKYFYAALDQARAYYEYGPPGTQKTFIVQRLIADLNQREVAKNGNGRRAVYVYCRAKIRPTDLMKRVAEAAGVSTMGNTDRILRNFRFDFRGRRAAVIFDEAQHLDNDCLETVRELLDRPPHAGLLFLGSHNLKQIFQQFELEQWRSRLHAGKALPGISDVEARDIAAKELGAGHSESKVSRMIEGARVPDLRQGKDYTYISARKLFWSIRDIKAALEHKEEATA